MAKNETNNANRIKEITLKITFHENRIAMHRSAINRLRKEKSALMGESADDGKHEE